jgi:hypothetical protein
MYEIWISQGQGVKKGPHLEDVEEVESFVRTFIGPGSLAVRRPDGSFLQFSPGRAMLRSKRMHARHAVDTSLLVDLRPGLRGGRGAVACRVSDVSDSGLRLELAGDPGALCRGAPLLVHLDEDDLWLPARLAWRRALVAGIMISTICSYQRVAYEAWIATIVHPVQQTFAAGSASHPRGD